MAATIVKADEPGQAGDFTVRLDTTFRASLAARTGQENAATVANRNADDGDRAFPAGLVSERADLLSELTAESGGFGFDVSGQGWYDSAYNTQHANGAPSNWNGIGSSPTGFSPDVRNLMGRQAELLNAFVRDSSEIAGIPVTVSVGRQTLLWGESLLFPENGIAASQAPVDDIKSLGAPLAAARELFLPVAQAVIRIGLGPGVSVEAYDQLEWRRDRLPGVGSFFSTTDILDQGGQRYLRAPGVPPLYRGSDVIPHGLGQFGAAFRVTGDAVDWGLFALRSDARAPVLVLDPARQRYQLIFPHGIGVFGGSASSDVGRANVAGEVSVRSNTPLDEVAGLAVPGGGAGNGGGSGGIGGSSGGGGGGLYAAARLHPAIARRLNAGFRVSRGTTIQAQSSVTTELPTGILSNATDIAAELAANSLLQGATPPGRTSVAVAIRAIMTLHYFHVLPGLDISAPLGFGVGLTGRSAVDASQNAGAGFVSAGLDGTFHVVWQAGLRFTHFIGNSSSQPLLDRDFATLSVARTF